MRPSRQSRDKCFRPGCVGAWLAKSTAVSFSTIAAAVNDTAVWLCSWFINSTTLAKQAMDLFAIRLNLTFHMHRTMWHNSLAYTNNSRILTCSQFLETNHMTQAQNICTVCNGNYVLCRVRYQHVFLGLSIVCTPESDGLPVEARKILALVKTSQMVKKFFLHKMVQKIWFKH